MDNALQAAAKGITTRHHFKGSKRIRKREEGARQHPGDQLRVSGKSRDRLQTIIAALRGQDFGLPLRFSNFRD
ncbi:DUF520 family protein [Acidithiobacillus sp.]|jgi:uncharacterized protein YajQ (UPF0234 family)|uniref:DUF520 family protein n=1 Tax=Acidithiobacillus sp. TaxID=1872118 RepID=UPI0026304D6C|nr:DUF520 family protein [Acidithiobacillus sp.]